MLRINHTADIHFSRKKAWDVFASLAVMEKQSSDVDLQIIAGDIWDSPVQNTGATQFPEFVATVSRMAKKAPIVMVQGTPSHDSDGSLDIFDQDENITVLKPGLAYWLGNNGSIWQKNTPVYPSETKALIFGVPEPQKKWLIASGADVTMDQALNALFLGYAAIRQQYADLPCILVYHGRVRGARMGHGQTAEDGVSIDDLALVGADYIAMGDIHIPQRIGVNRGLNAYYPGAIHPTGDWKDSDYQFGFNRVEIGKKLDEGNPQDLFGNGSGTPFTTVTRINFPHPVLTKLTYLKSATRGEIEGKRVWLELTGTKQEQAITDTTAILDELMTYGAAPGSKVTFKTLSTETVRAGTIATLRRLSDKFKLWAENSGKTLTPDQLEKADQIEAEASGKGLILHGGHFTFDRLELHGSKGIWKNQRKDHVTFDLTALDSGIVGLIGENGKGKTTIMNNFHPWPEMPNFGSDPLYKHFRLKDSYREFYATEVNTGIQYKSLIKINAIAKTCEYFLFINTPLMTWQPVPGIDGRLKSYESEVNRIFGTLEMYLRTAFMMQFPTSDHPDLSRATKGTKKAIMSALAGLDYFEVYKATAKAKAETLENDFHSREGRIEIMLESLPDFEALKEKLNNAQLEYADINSHIPLKLEAGKTLAAEVKALEAQMASQKVIEDQMIEAINKIPRDQLAGRIAEDSIHSAQSIILGRTAAEAIIKQHAELTEREFLLNSDKTLILEQNAINQRAYQDKKDAYDVRTREIEAEIRGIEHKYQDDKNAIYQRNTKAMDSWNNTVREYDYKKNQLVSSLALTNQDIARNESDLAKPIEDHCPTCKQMMPEQALQHVKGAKKELEIIIKGLLFKADLTQKEIDSLGPRPVTPVAEVFDESKIAAELEPLKLNLRKHQQSLEAAPTSAYFDDYALTSLRTQIQAIDITKARQTIEQAGAAQARIEELTKQVAEIRTRIADNQRTAEELKSKIDSTLLEVLTDKSRELETARNEYNRLNAALARSESEIKHAEKSLAEYDVNLATIEAIKSELSGITGQLADWNLLVQACGQNGIQALELDAVCPTIASVANKLLEEYEDGRYSIRFDTTREGGKGNQIEDFLIMVIDNKDGGEQEFETLSGGECTWIRKALTDSFGIIRGQNAGIKYLTGFLDESDSALFPDSRIAYFRMIESAHTQSVRRHTVMVTHDPSIQEMISTKVEVTSL